MKFKKDGKVFDLAEAIFEYCKTAECSFCSICDAVKYTCGNGAKDLADLMGFEVIDEPTIGEIVAKHSEDDTPTAAEAVEKHGEDVKPKRRTLGASNPTEDMTEYVEKYLEAVKPDPVNRPAHYTSSGIECIDAMQAAFGAEAVKDFCLCNAFKYLWRHRNKNGVEDLKKCRWYLNRLIREMEVTEDDT